MYIQVNIGRNFVAYRYNATGGTLSDLEWSEFQEDVKYALVQFREHSDMGDPKAEVHCGVGVWDEKEEMSAHISLFHEGGFDTDGLKNYLFGLKGMYSQESIAIILGSQLIESVLVV